MNVRVVYYPCTRLSLKMRRYHVTKSSRKRPKDKESNVANATSSGDDYMSMDFILNAQSFDDNRNSVVNKRRKASNKRKLFTDKKEKKYEPPTKKLKVRMEEERNKGLAKPISENNIGFKLLSKMGYKNGMIIGKKNNVNKNKNDNNDPNKQIILKEPISIKIRDKNSGLGIHEAKERKVEALSILIKTQKMKRNNLFKQSIRQKSKHKGLIKDIKQSMIICENLDIQNDVNLTNPIWFKDKEEHKKQATDEYEQDEDEDIDEIAMLSFNECQDKLKEILIYLRCQHIYCYWCGIKYKDEQEMDKSCPGNDKSLHDSLDDF